MRRGSALVMAEVHSSNASLPGTSPGRDGSLSKCKRSRQACEAPGKGSWKSPGPGMKPLVATAESQASRRRAACRSSCIKGCR